MLCTVLLFYGNFVLLAIGVVLILLETFEFLRGKIFLFLRGKKKKKRWRRSVLCLPCPSAIALCCLFLTQEGCLHGPCVALRLSFHTWGWMNSCAQAARMPSCSCLMSGAGAVGHEQWMYLDNFLPSGTHFYWFLLLKNLWKHFLPSRLKWLVASFWTFYCKELRAKTLSDCRQ